MKSLFLIAAAVAAVSAADQQGSADSPPAPKPNVPKPDGPKPDGPKPDGPTGDALKAALPKVATKFVTKTTGDKCSDESKKACDDKTFASMAEVKSECVVLDKTKTEKECMIEVRGINVKGEKPTLCKETHLGFFALNEEITANMKTLRITGITGLKYKAAAAECETRQIALAPADLTVETCAPKAEETRVIIAKDKQIEVTKDLNVTYVEADSFNPEPKHKLVYSSAAKDAKSANKCELIVDTEAVYNFTGPHKKSVSAAVSAASAVVFSVLAANFF